jgi:hypothetical protein
LLVDEGHADLAEDIHRSQRDETHAEHRDRPRFRKKRSAQRIRRRRRLTEVDEAALDAEVAIETVTEDGLPSAVLVIDIAAVEVVNVELRLRYCAADVESDGRFDRLGIRLGSKHQQRGSNDGSNQFHQPTPGDVFRARIVRCVEGARCTDL